MASRKITLGGIGMNVGDRMTNNPVTVAPGDTLAVAQEKLRSGGFRQLPVVDEDRLVGILTDRDLRKHGRHIVAKVKSAMTTEVVVTVTPQTPIEEAARLLLQHKIGGLPVVDDDKLVGIISTTDLLKTLIDLLRDSKAKASGR